MKNSLIVIYLHKIAGEVVVRIVVVSSDGNVHPETGWIPDITADLAFTDYTS